MVISDHGNQETTRRSFRAGSRNTETQILDFDPYGDGPGGGGTVSGSVPDQAATSGM
jgi:hypothetical protein